MHKIPMERLASRDWSGSSKEARVVRLDCSDEQSRRLSRRVCTEFSTEFEVCVLLIIMYDSKLIELVRDHPSMFNPKHPQYKDAYVRENVWTMVPKEMELPSKIFIFFFYWVTVWHYQLIQEY